MKKKLSIIKLLSISALMMFSCETMQQELPNDPMNENGAKESLNENGDLNARKNSSNQFGAFLIGTEEVPSVNSMGAGAAFFEITEGGETIKFQVRVANTKEVIFAHIHRGAFGANGPVVVDLVPRQDPSGLINGVLAEGIIEMEDIKMGSMQDLIKQLMSGMAYVNVHTSTFPSGELRGQISAIESNDNNNFTSRLSGDQEVPAFDTKANGIGIFRFSKDLNVLDFRMNVSNIEDILFSHIHLGKKGQNGPVVITLDGDKKEGSVNGLYASGRLTNQSLRGKLLGGDLMILKEAFRTGNAYINIHSAKSPSGELRGQL